MKLTKASLLFLIQPSLFTPQPFRPLNEPFLLVLLSVKPPFTSFIQSSFQPEQNSLPFQYHSIFLEHQRIPFLLPRAFFPSHLLISSFDQSFQDSSLI